MLPFSTERWREMEIWKVRALYCTVYPISVLLSSPFKSAYFAGKNVENRLALVGGLLGSL